MPTPNASLIISVYNNVRFLNAVLDSVLQQTYRDIEIIVTEDGECEEMKFFLENYPFDLPWQHLTQPDIGWRKNRALNRAILASNTDYLIFIDGDCVMHPRFIEQHIKQSTPDRILGGKRIKLNEELTSRFLNSTQHPNAVERYVLKHLFHLKKKGILFSEEGFFLSSESVFGFISGLRNIKQLKGCNMSFHKEAIKELNGFDEAYIHPAIGEDIDLTWRFLKAGYTLHSVRNLAIQYHLQHKENWHNQDENKRMMEDKMKKGEFRCNNGLEKTSD